MKGIEMTVEQGSPEWHALRRERVTASRVGLLLRNPDAFRREWIRDQLGEGFQGNEATAYGQAAEPLAADWFAAQYSVELRSVGFVVDEQEPRLGCSPDRVFNWRGGDALLEIKCPYSKALPDEPDPDHVAQLRCQLGITGLHLGVLLYWTPDGSREFEVKDAPWFMDEVRTAVADFFASLPDAQIGDRSDAEWRAASAAWVEAKATLAAAQAAEEAARSALLLLSDERDASGCGVKVTWVTRQGTVAWAKLAKEFHVPKEAIEEFRGEPSRYAKVEAL
jgi:hypothetical protein